MNWFGFVHYLLHLVLPGVVAYVAAPRLGLKRLWVYLVWIATMLVDLDHLWAEPIFDPERCSIGFHPLHSELALVFYVLMIVYPNMWVRLVGVGLVWHMIVDGLDCFL